MMISGPVYAPVQQERSPRETYVYVEMFNPVLLEAGQITSEAMATQVSYWSMKLLGTRLRLKNGAMYEYVEIYAADHIVMARLRLIEAPPDALTEQRAHVKEEALV